MDQGVNKEQNQEQMDSEFALFQTILDTTSDMITVIDIETYQIIYANASAIQVTQDLVGKYVGTTCYQSIMHGDQPCEDCILSRPQSVTEETKDLVYGNRIYCMTYKIMTWKGRRVLIEYSSDVTALREKEKAFQQQVDFIVHLDRDNLIAKGRHNLTKNQPVEVTGKHMGAVVGSLHTDYDSMVLQLADTAVDDCQRQELLEMLDRQKLLEGFAAGKREISLNYRRYLPNRGICLATLQGALYQDPATRDIFAFYYTYDNTEQLLQSMVVKKINTTMFLYLGVIDVESQQCIVLYPKADTDHFSHERNVNYDLMMQEEMKQLNIIGDRQKLMDQVSFRSILDRLYKKGYYLVDYSMTDKMGNFQRVSVQFSFLDEARKLILYYTTDITESYEQDQKKLQEISDALQQAETSNRAKTDFLSRMSHDMRTPMNGVLGLVTLLLDEELSEQVRDGLLQIQFSGKYLLNLINDTLDVNKIEANRLELRYQPIDAFKLTQNVAINAKMLAADKGVFFDVVRIHPERITPTILLMDEARTEQLFMNLISNAIKFTPAGGNVWVTIERLETTEEYTVNRYQFKDTGIGMSQEFLQHIYEPFSQEGRINTARESGTGLGMAIVWQLVQLMGATLEVESTLDVGTTFTLTIRFERFQGTVKEPELERWQAEAFQEKRALLFEDHPLNRQIAQRLLMKKGIVVDVAEDGAKGVEMFQKAPEHTYDFLLMDIRMPIMNGLEATKAIRACDRQDAQTIPIIAMTANAFDDDIKECLAAGMNAHISKPIEVDKMFQTIYESLN